MNNYPVWDIVRGPIHMGNHFVHSTSFRTIHEKMSWDSDLSDKLQVFSSLHIFSSFGRLPSIAVNSADYGIWLRSAVMNSSFIQCHISNGKILFIVTKQGQKAFWINRQVASTAMSTQRFDITKMLTISHNAFCGSF